MLMHAWHTRNLISLSEIKSLVRQSAAHCILASPKFQLSIRSNYINTSAIRQGR
jgi:ABC-type Zn2+ transport system substrate-binding protein/surface adhesin